MTPEQIARFEGKINRTPTCWLWTAGLNAKGYGKVKINGRTVGAHRVAYEHWIGPIPEGLVICHSCDVPRCVNPAHLRADTQRGNINEAHAKGRKQGAPPGERNHQAKITEEIARAILADRRSQKVIAAAYGISQAAVSDIQTGRRWAHLGQRTGRGRVDLRGEERPNAKLTQSKADAIRHDTRAARVVAADYGVSVGLIYAIRSGRAWSFRAVPA